MDENVIDLIHRVNQVILNPILRILFLFALIYFIWGLFSYIKNSDSDKERETGRSHMLWGVVGMFVMISVFGIINLIMNTFGVDGGTRNDLNQVIKR